jgi:hypothetical protein
MMSGMLLAASLRRWTLLMPRRWILLAAMLLGTFAQSSALADGAVSDDRIAVSVDGSTLTGTDGGGGASLGWLHDFSPGTLTGVAVEHQVLANSQWTFGSLNGSYALGPENQRFNLYGEAHEGGGVDASHSFRYEIEAAGVFGTFDHKLSAQLEDKRIDVQFNHGNLPKAGLSYLWGPHLLTTASYQYSTSGNLGTRIEAARLDVYAASWTFFAGAALGPASPAIFDIEVSAVNVPTDNILVRARELHEEYLGVSKPLSRWHSVLTVTADYLDLSGIVRASLAATYIFHF